MEKNKVTITIRNQQYTVVSEESPQDIKLLSEVVDKKLGEIMGTGGRISLTEALVLVSLDLANGMKKSADIVSKYKRELDKIKGKN